MRRTRGVVKGSSVRGYIDAQDREMPRDLWRFDLSVEGVADLSDIDRSAAVGLRALGTTRASPGGMLTSGMSYVSRVYPLH